MFRSPCYSLIVFTVSLSLSLLLLNCHPIDAQRNSVNGPSNADLARIALLDRDMNPNQPTSVINLEATPTAGSSISGRASALITPSSSNSVSISSSSSPTPMPNTMVLLVTHVFASFPTPNITITRASHVDDANGSVKLSSSSPLVYQLSVIFYSMISIGILLLTSIGVLL